MAHCYLNRPILTAEKFTPDPFAESPGQRLYRSGDLVRRRQDGNIVFIGRNDFQVKIRGFRVELEEVESVIKRHPVVVDAVVAVTADPGKERRLVAYIVARPGLELTISELRRFMTERLPEYMAPAVLVQIDNLPLTTNGKIDRSKLPDPGQARPDMDLEFIGPRTQIEHSLCEAWARVLGLDKVGVRDNFFDLGGDSIRSIQIMSRSEEAGCAFSIQELFQNPTIESLAAIVESRDGRRKRIAPAEPFSLVKEQDRALLPESIEDAYPLTMLQAGMIFHSELSPSTAVYHDIFSFHMQSRLDPEIMRESLSLVISRHPVLRTSFRLIGRDHPLQLVHRDVAAPFHFEDISHLDVPQQQAFVGALIQSEKSTGFSWDRPPLLRLWVHKRSVGSFQFTLSFHHAILDGWSLATMLAELFESYLARLEGRTETHQAATSNSSFRDFVALEIEAVNSDDCRRFWIERLDRAPFTAIPRSASAWRQPEPLGEIGVCMLEVTDQLSGMLNSLSRSLGVPLKSVLLAGHAKVLALINGENEIVTGIVTNGRPEERDADKVMGLF
ncbi:MAG: condensation domain-containing protein, partial [Blastocatellia bacterium]